MTYIVVPQYILPMNGCPVLSPILLFVSDQIPYQIHYLWVQSLFFMLKVSFLQFGRFQGTLPRELLRYIYHKPYMVKYSCYGAQPCTPIKCTRTHVEPKNRSDFILHFLLVLNRPKCTTLYQNISNTFH